MIFGKYGGSIRVVSNGPVISGTIRHFKNKDDHLAEDDSQNRMFFDISDSDFSLKDESQRRLLLRLRSSVMDIRKTHSEFLGFTIDVSTSQASITVDKVGSRKFNQFPCRGYSLSQIFGMTTI
jgi:hypothetical protein